MELNRTFAETARLLAGGAGVLLCAATAQTSEAQTTAVNPQLQQRRLEVLAAGQNGVAGLPALTAALKDPNVLVRRAAVRSLEQIGVPAVDALAATLKNDSDALVRRTALRALIQLRGSEAAGVLEPALTDSSELVRGAAVGALADMRPHTPQVIELLKKAQQDKSPTVSQIASQALWPAALRKEGVSLRELPQFKDTQLTVAQTIPLPKTGWRFQTDLGQIGHTVKWFAPDFADADWKTIEIEQAWETQIDQPYDGAAWYRTTFTLPDKPAQVGTDLVFDSVDESAWVWINGQYVGQHDIGPDGWNQRFAMDISNFLKWGEENHITVRVMDRVMAGGIWKPVYLEVLKK